MKLWSQILLKKIISLLLFLSVSSAMPGQISVSIDRDCLERNSALLSQHIIDLKGSHFISCLLEDNVSFSCFCGIDSTGNIVNVDIIHYKGKSHKKFIKELKSSLLKDILNFKACYELPSGVSEGDALRIINKEFRSGGNIMICFPGPLMIHYNYESDNLKNQGKILSGYEYLQIQIKKYLR